MILKIAILKKVTGVQSEKVRKQVRDQIKAIWKQLKMPLKGSYGMEINSKAFAIPILTASYIVNYKLDAVRIGIASALEFISIL